MNMKKPSTGRVVLALLLLAGLLAGCAGRRPSGAGQSAKEQPTFSGTAFINPGEGFELIVDVRASWIAKRQDFLPLLIAVRNKVDERIEFTKESFRLEGSDGSIIPLASNFEFERDYRRYRIDYRAGESFLETLNGRFPTPPFRTRMLEFYPAKESRISPREEQSARQAEIIIGYIYFRIPDENFIAEDGKCKLLFRPKGHDNDYVLDLPVYKN